MKGRDPWEGPPPNPPRLGEGVAARGLAAFGFLVLLTSGCIPGQGGGPARSAASSSPRAASPSSSPAQQARASPGTANPLNPPSTPTLGPAVASDLQLTGPLSGRVQNAQPVGVCGKGPVGFSVQLRFTLGGGPYVLGMDVLDYSGPGTYKIPPERVAIRSDTRSGTPTFLPATSGVVQVAPGESSGQVDAALISDGGGHLKGSWSCA